MRVYERQAFSSADAAHDVKLEQLSMSLVLRGLLIKHLIASGHTGLQFTGGTSLSLGRFCTLRSTGPSSAIRL
jgi:hypothetical protein